MSFPVLVPNFNFYDFGGVVVGSDAGVTISFKYVANPGDPSITVNSVDVDDTLNYGVGGFAAFPIIMFPGDTISGNLIFGPTGLGDFPATVTCSSDAPNDPVQISIDGQGIPNNRVLTAIPNLLDFGSIKILVPSAPMDVMLQNTGPSLSVTVTALNLDPQVTCTNPPAFPFTLNPGDTAGPFHFVFTPTVAGFDSIPNAIQWVSNAVGTPTLVAVQAVVFLITPAFVLTGAVQQLLLSFVGAGNPVTKSSDGEDLNCEEDGHFQKIVDFGLASIEKTLQRLFFRYENLGSGQVTAAFKSTRSGAQPTDTKNIGSAGADGLVYNSYWDAQLSHDLIQILISRLGDTGPVSLTEFVAKVVVKGEYVEGSN
jgi:hypothetical protein